MTRTPLQPQPPAVAERDIQTAILRAFATRDDVRLWRANCGAAETATGRIIKFGIKGQADLSGILPGGIRLEIEVKTATGRQSADQRAFGEMIKRWGGVYVLARSVADVETALAPFLDTRRPEPTA